jgi:dephospho-CoA kinase
LIIGLTGGIGAGKSTVARLFHQLGIHCVDADRVARDLVEPGTPLLAQLVAHFGPELLDRDQLNRAKLRQIIFQEPSAKAWLEQQMHPLIRAEIHRTLREPAFESPYQILEAPLLFENQLESLCHSTILVDTSVELQMERTVQRDGSTSATIAAIIASQMPADQKRLMADHIVHNSGDLDDLSAQVTRLHHQLIDNQTAKPETA